MVILPEVPLLYRIALAILDFLFFYMMSNIVLSRSGKNCAESLMGIVLNLSIAFRKIAIFTMLIPPINYNGRSFHFLVFSSKT